MPNPQDLLKNVLSFFTPKTTPTATPAQPSYPQSKIPTPVTTFPQSKIPPPPIQVNASPFQKATAGLVTTALTNIGLKVKSVAQDTYQGEKDVASGKVPVSLDDWLSGIKRTAVGLGTGVDSMAKGFNEGVFRILGSAEEKINPARGSFIAHQPWVQKFVKDTTGKDNIDTYQAIYKKAGDFADANNATPQEKSMFSGISVLGTMFADNPLIGPEKGALKLTADAVEQLAKETDERAIASTLKKENPHLTAQEISVMTPVFKNAQSPAEIHLVTQQINKVAQATVEKPKGLTPGYMARDAAERAQETRVVPEGATPKTSQDAARIYREAVIEPAQADGKMVRIGADDLKDYFGKDYNDANHPIYSQAAFDIYKDALKVNPNPKVILTGGGPGSGKTELLIKNLERKEFDGIVYDSNLSSYQGAVKQIEEARKAGKEVEIHGILPDLEKARGFTMTREASSGRGISDKTFARGHAGFPKVVQQLIENGIIDAKDVHLYDMRTEPSLAHAIAKVARKGTETNPLETVKNLGYTEENLQRDYGRARFEQPGKKANAVGNAERAGLPVRSSETPNLDRPVPRPADDGRATQVVRNGDLRRGGESTIGKGEQRKFSPNTLKQISQADLPGPIADVLRKEFPTLSDRLLSKVAVRMTGMHRTSDIEGMLRTLDSVGKRLESDAAKPARAATAVDATQPKAIADLLTPDQKDVYMGLINRSMEKREDSVLAQQEYDALWEQADQGIIDHYNALVMTREFLADELGAHPGKELIKYVSRATGELPEVTGLPKIKALSGSGKTVRNSIFGQKGDAIAIKHGFATPEEAQKALDSYVKMRNQLADIADEIREVRPRARGAQAVQTLTQDVPVVLQKKAGEIDAFTTADAISHHYKDISGFKAQVRDVYRNFRDVFGKNFPAVKKAILDPFDASKGDAIDEMTRAGDRLASNVVDKLGIKRGSKESAAVMDYGEGKLSDTELEARFGAKASKIREAATWFKGEYDSFINQLNEVRGEIYPNDPTKLIQKRKDYFRHFQELSGDSVKDFFKVIFDTPAGIDPNLAGISEFTKPKSKFLSFAQERLGKSSERDAVGGYIDYVPAYAFAKHLDKHIGNFRYLRRKLAENAPRPGTTEILEKNGKTVATKQKGVNNFLEYLDDYANNLAGKTNPMDRYVQKIIPGGRKTFKVMDMVNNRIKANTILGNVSSAVAQIFNVPQGVASAKQYSLHGINRTMASIFAENTPMLESSFIKERYHRSMKDRFNIDWAAHPVKAGTERAKKFAAWMTGALDEVGTKFIWNSHYAKGVAQGVENPVKYADDVTRRMVAGRGVGEKPLIQNSKLFNIAAPFSLEVGNTWWVLGDFVKAKDFGAVALFFVASYLMNEAANKTRGSRVVFDPINAVLEGSAEASDEMNAGNPGRAALKFGGRTLGEALSNMPLGQTFASVIPDQWVQDSTAYFTGAPIDKKELFGSADPNRFGSTVLPVSGLTDPLYRLALPFGGTQVKKTKDAIASMLSGHVDTNAGKLSFKAPTDPLSVVQAFLFGKNATGAAQKAFDERDDLFQRVYTQTAARTVAGLDAEAAWKEIKDIKKSQGGEAAAAKFQEYAAKDPDIADKIMTIADDENKGLDGTDRLIGMLGVKNGERAKYLVDVIKKLPKDQRASYVQDLATKKLITDDVIDQMAYLLNGK